MLANDLAFLPINDDVPLHARVAVGEPKFLPIRTTQNDFVQRHCLLRTRNPSNSLPRVPEAAPYKTRVDATIEPRRLTRPRLADRVSGSL
jgi:hypothetical protein